MNERGWTGVDLDGVLAVYPANFPSIGPPIMAMVDRVKRWIADDVDVRIFTARVHQSTETDWVESAASYGHTPESWIQEQHALIAEWCLEHLGAILPITCEKDFRMIELWDDRCVQMIPNTGQSLKELVQADLQDIARMLATPPAE